MRELPIIFCTDMVRATLEDRKTHTRRLDKLQKINREPDNWEKPFYNKVTGLWEFCHKIDQYVLEIKPKYQVGDKLWVKETYAIHKTGSLTKESLPLFEYTKYSIDKPDRLKDGYELIYKATQNIDPDFPIYWRSSRFMPKWAARIWLEVTGVRVERLQDISEEDCLKEGITMVNLPHNVTLFRAGTWPDPKAADNAIGAFYNLWDSLNSKRGYPWQLNPWVTVNTFKKIQSK